MGVWVVPRRRHAVPRYLEQRQALNWMRDRLNRIRVFA
jgi:hypothetical protein